MKKLLSSTAVVVALGFPAMALAQTTATTTAPAADQATMQQQGHNQAFLSARGASDLYASELIGRDVYARRAAVDGAATDATTAPAAGATSGTAPAATTATDAGAATGTGTAAMGTGSTQAGSMHAGGMRGMNDLNRADLDNMDNIGQINEIILSSDGEVRALIIGVGGFLGMGEQDVAVSMDQVSFASDPEDRSDVYVMIDSSSDMLQDSPAFDRAAMTDDTAMTTRTPGAAGTTAPGANQVADRQAFVAPDMQREGYAPLEAMDITADLLTGQTVYDVNDDNVGDIDDLILDESGAITQVVIDFGGFLGIGSNQVAVGFDELTILRDTGTMGGTDVRVYIDATVEQVQSQPQYEVAN